MSVTPNLGLTLPAGSDWADVAVLNQNWEKIDRQVLRAIAAAADYDQEATYQKGDFCTQGGLLYRANQAIEQPEAWTAGHWTAISITDVIRGLTAEDVGAAPAPLNAALNLYVNGTTGSDSNDGSQENPFKTIQHAIDVLPKVITGGRATINIAAGNYQEDIEIIGFTGSASYNPAISLQGAGIGSTIITGQIYITCQSPVWLYNLSLSAGTSGRLVEIYFNTGVRLNNIAIDGSGAPNATAAITSQFSTLYAFNVQITNAAKAAFSLIGTTFLQNVSGQNNAVGVIAGGSAIGSPALVVTSTIPTSFATVKYQKYYGSAVIENGVLV